MTEGQTAGQEMHKHRGARRTPITGGRNGRIIINNKEAGRGEGVGAGRSEALS